MSKFAIHCDECSKRNPAEVVVKPEIWAKISPQDRRAWLCLQCMEDKLGRKIMWDDLLDNGTLDNAKIHVVILMQTIDVKKAVELNMIETKKEL